MQGQQAPEFALRRLQQEELQEQLPVPAPLQEEERDVAGSVEEEETGGRWPAAPRPMWGSCWGAARSAALGSWAWPF